MTDKEKAKALDIIMEKFGLSLDRLWLDSEEEYRTWLIVDCQSAVRLTKEETELVDTVFDSYEWYESEK